MIGTLIIPMTDNFVTLPTSNISFSMPDCDSIGQSDELTHDFQCKSSIRENYI